MNKPKEIYLANKGIDERYWTETKINDTDIVYIRSDIVEEMVHQYQQEIKLMRDHYSSQARGF